MGQFYVPSDRINDGEGRKIAAKLIVKTVVIGALGVTPLRVGMAIATTAWDIASAVIKKSKSR